MFSKNLESTGKKFIGLYSSGFLPGLGAIPISDIF